MRRTTNQLNTIQTSIIIQLILAIFILAFIFLEFQTYFVCSKKIYVTPQRLCAIQIIFFHFNIVQRVELDFSFLHLLILSVCGCVCFIVK